MFSDHSEKVEEPSAPLAVLERVCGNVEGAGSLRCGLRLTLGRSAKDRRGAGLEEGRTRSGVMIVWQMVEPPLNMLSLPQPPLRDEGRSLRGL